MKNLNLQDVFLNHVRKERMSVTVYLTNGFQFRGVVKGFDNYIIVLDCDGKQNIVYKHAVSTIIPSRPVSLLTDEEDEKPGKETEN
ncbi:MAG TPA: RNA chaperone Hfq [Candidatus Merdivicinus intestinavium]|nr:RNA chaperone Hfq [Candidatus Merdivicinus intestinavium]